MYYPVLSPELDVYKVLVINSAIYFIYTATTQNQKYKYFFEICNVNGQQPNFRNALLAFIVISQMFYLK